MNQTNFAPTDIFVTPVNATNVQVPTNDYHLKTVIGGGEKTLYNSDKIRDHAKLHGLAAARLTDYIKINAIFSDPDSSPGDINAINVIPDIPLTRASSITEIQHHIGLMSWAKTQPILDEYLIHIPNGGYRSIRGIKVKKNGR